MFYGREKELKELNDRYDDGRFECMIIYGRRRVGKTALINEFCRDKPTVFFSALRSSSSDNLEALSKAIYEKNDTDAVSAPVYRSFDDAFAEITRMGERERLVFVIDEYPYLAKAEKSVSSRLQHLIDRVWQNGKIFLILCGSSMSFMEKQVLGRESPLYGRRTGQIKMQAMTYDEIAVFNPSLSCEQQALIYGITGGIPHYINKLDVKKSVDEALKKNFFNRSAYLFEEPENLLKQELREPTLYNSIITAIAGGASKMSEISTKCQIAGDVCAKYLKVLIGLGIVKKETPVTEKPGKKTIYRISDNFFTFWYRFVPPYLSAIESDRIDRIYDTAIKGELPNYMGLVFEQMCRTYLIKNDDKLPVLISNVGRWWGTDKKEKKEVEIDLVGVPVKGKEYLICSCKYKNSAVGVDELEKLREYAAVFGKGSRYHYYIFSKGGFTEGLKAAAVREEVTLVSLEDMY